MASQPEQRKADPSSVPLPNRRPRDELSTINKNRVPIWSVEEAPGPDMPSVPLQAKCSAHGEGRRGVCCRELIGDDERQLIDPDIVRDVYVPAVVPPALCPCRLTQLTCAQRYRSLGRTYCTIRFGRWAFVFGRFKARRVGRCRGTHCRSDIYGHWGFLGISS